MPIVGFGVHILLALLCAIHAVRSGQPLYWLFILFAFPLLGSIVYVVVVYLPNSRLERGARRAVAAAANALDPERDLREARAAFDDSPTAQNRMRLASALQASGAAEEAARAYEGCLKGPFATDLEIRFGAARAFVECQHYQDALGHLEAIRDTNSTFRTEALSLLLARSYAGTSRPEDARNEFESAVSRFGSFDTRAEYAIWAMATGDTATASRLQTEIDQMTRRWNAHARMLNASTMRRLKAAYELAEKRA